MGRNKTKFALTICVCDGSISNYTRTILGAVTQRFRINFKVINMLIGEPAQKLCGSPIPAESINMMDSQHVFFLNDAPYIDECLNIKRLNIKYQTMFNPQKNMDIAFVSTNSEGKTQYTDDFAYDSFLSLTQNVKEAMEFAFFLSAKRNRKLTMVYAKEFPSHERLYKKILHEDAIKHRSVTVRLLNYEQFYNQFLNNISLFDVGIAPSYILEVIAPIFKPGFIVGYKNYVDKDYKNAIYTFPDDLSYYDKALAPALVALSVSEMLYYMLNKKTESQWLRRAVYLSLQKEGLKEEGLLDSIIYELKKPIRNKKRTADA